MPQVPYSPFQTVAPSVPAEYSRVNATPDSFGAQVGGAIQGLGHEISKSAELFAAHADRMKALSDKAAAEEAQIELTKKLDTIQFDVNTGYINQKGKNAVAGYQSAHEAAEQARKDVLGSIQDPMVKRMLEGPAAHQTMTALRTMSRHAADENRTYLYDTNVASSQALIDSMGLNYTADPAPTINALKQKAIERVGMKGLGDADSDAAKAEISKSISALQVARISTQRVHDPVGALDTFQQVSGQLNAAVRYQLAEKIFADAAPVIAAEIARSPTLETIAINDAEGQSLLTVADKMGKQVKVRVNGEAKTVFDRLPADEKLKVLHLAETMMKQDKSQQVAAVRHQVEDTLAAGAQGVRVGNPPTQEQLSVLDPETARRVTQQLDENSKFVDAVAKLNATPTSQMTALFNDITRLPAAGEGTRFATEYNARLSAAANLVITDRNKDPAAAAAKSSIAVRGALGALQESYATVKDPNVRRQITDFYARTTLAEQTRLEVSNPSILTQEMRAGIINQAIKEEGSQRTVQMIKQLSDDWGKHWPPVYGQLSKALPQTTRVIGSGMAEAPAMILQGLTGEKMKDIDKFLSGTDKTDIKAQLKKEFEQGYNSLVSSNPIAGRNTFNDFYDSAEKMAAYYMSLGKSAKDASKQAYKETFGDKYEFVKSGPAYVRIPKAQDASLISSGMSVVRQGADSLGVAPLLSFAGLDEKERIARTLDTIRSEGYWVTSSDESGATLYLRDSTHVGGAPVLDTKGNTIYRSWYALQQAAQMGSVVAKPVAGTSRAFGESGGGAAAGVSRRRNNAPLP